MNFKRILLWAAGAALLVAALFSLDKIDQFWQLLGEAKWQFLILIPVVQMVSYWSNAKYYQSFLALFDYRQSLGRLLEVAVVINFVNQVFPSGGISGASFLSRSLEGVPVGKSTLAQIFRYIFTYFTFIVVLALGFMALFLGGDIQQTTARLIWLFILVIIATSIAVIALVSNRRAVEEVGGWFMRLVNRLGRLFRRPKPLLRPAVLSRFYDEFYHGIDILHGQRGRWGWPLLYTLIGNLAEVATVYVAFLAFGQMVNPGLVIAGYGLANFFSLISVVTTGVGVYEGVMVATFVALGLAFTLSLSVTIVYRVLNLIIFLPLGFYLYRRNL